MILFIDDEDLLLKVWSNILSIHGYEVEACKDTKQALSLFVQEPYKYDLVIMDQSMPGLSGYDLAIEINKARKDIPIIVCSGHTDNFKSEKSGELGIRKFLPKPMDKNTLISAIEEILGQ